MICGRCSSEAVWVNNGPRLQYHYCRECRVEVNNTNGLDYPARFSFSYSISHDDMLRLASKNRTKEEVEAIANETTKIFKGLG